MHVEPPEGPIRSIQQFLIQIFTITVGLLIALGLEGLVARHHEHNLVVEARRNLQAELTECKTKLIANLATQRDAEKAIERLIAFAGALHKDRHATPPASNLSRTFVVLPSTSWDAAVAIGAIALMPYREVRDYSAAYQGERAYMDLENDAKRASFELSAFDGDYAGMSDAAIENGERQLKISLTYAMSLESTGVIVLQELETALANPAR
jgi:hypothetical protein